ncbi:recombinase family protein [Microbulbifer taiwanensis]|uniref:Recombinase family protein n=1 Tax=Microbulbifer taiwanensis TaxID=986746 RepID=A0ABW1YRM2_9GAMM|nr:recombinase family protein [Microbulbifer taiwanensis]
MKPKAYQYVRFSTTAQEKGDSIRRQIDTAKKFAEVHNLDYDDSLKLHDLGVSAYKGKNLESGNLKRFIDLVEDGTIAKGSYLLLQNFDRFSRMEPRKALAPLLTLVNSGIKVAVIDNNKIHGEENDGAIELLATILHMERSHDESRIKSINIRSAKRNAKQDLLDGKRKVLGKWSAPKWLDIAEDGQGDEGTGYKINHERVKVIKKILEWVIEGRGNGYILERLTKQGVEPWGSGSGIKVDKRKPNQWHNSSITRIVNNRKLIGELEISIPSECGESKRKEIIQNHFPAIISEEYYEKVQAARRSRDLNRDEDGNLKADQKMRGGGRKGKTISNLFQKLAVCGYSVDGNASKYRCPDKNRGMVYANKDSKYNGKIYENRYLQCAAAKEKGSKCKGCRVLYRYDDFEVAFFTHVKDIPESVITGTDNDRKTRTQIINNKIESLNNQLEEANRQITKYKKAMQESNAISRTIMDELIKYESRQDEIPREIRKLESEKRLVDSRKEQGKELHNNLIGLIAKMNECKDDKKLYELRFKVQGILQSLIDKIEVFNRGNFISDEVTDQKIERMKKNAGNNWSIEIENAIRKSDKQRMESTAVEAPYFVIRYKSGESRLVMPHTEDPTKIHMNMKLDESGSLDNLEWRPPSPIEAVNI